MPEAVRRRTQERRRPVLAGLAVVATLGFTVSLPSAALAAPAPVKPSPAAPDNASGQNSAPRSGTTTAGPTTTTTTTTQPADQPPGRPTAAPVSSPAAPAPVATTSTASGASTGTGKTTTGSTAAGPAKAAPQQAAPQAAGPQVAGPQISGPKVAGPQARPVTAPANRTLIGPVARTAPLAAPVRASPFTARPATPFGPQVQRRSTAAAAVQGPRIPTHKAKVTTSAAPKPVRKSVVAPAAPAPGIIPDTEVLPALNNVVRRAAGEPIAPLLVALIVGLFLLVQHRIDRKDPKLARVQLDQEPLTFRRLSYS